MPIDGIRIESIPPAFVHSIMHSMYGVGLPIISAYAYVFLPRLPAYSRILTFYEGGQSGNKDRQTPMYPRSSARFYAFNHAVIPEHSGDATGWRVRTMRDSVGG